MKSPKRIHIVDGKSARATNRPCRMYSDAKNAKDPAGVISIPYSTAPLTDWGTRRMNGTEKHDAAPKRRQRRRNAAEKKHYRQNCTEAGNPNRDCEEQNCDPLRGRRQVMTQERSKPHREYKKHPQGKTKHALQLTAKNNSVRNRMMKKKVIVFRTVQLVSGTFRQNQDQAEPEYRNCQHNVPKRNDQYPPAGQENCQQIIVYGRVIPAITRAPVLLPHLIRRCKFGTGKLADLSFEGAVAEVHRSSWRRSCRMFSSTPFPVPRESDPANAFTDANARTSLLWITHTLSQKLSAMSTICVE